jgi:hypothetical protein
MVASLVVGFVQIVADALCGNRLFLPRSLDPCLSCSGLVFHLFWIREMWLGIVCGCGGMAEVCRSRGKGFPRLDTSESSPNDNSPLKDFGIDRACFFNSNEKE